MAKKTDIKAAKSAKKMKMMLLSDKSPFIVKEAYKTLRTNMMFTMLGEECKIIEVTSCIQGEGKSTTSINLAITLAETGARVALIDCDLRAPTDALKLDIPVEVGLSNVLAGMVPWKKAMVQCEQGMHLLAAGEIPPNPSEMLNSKQMGQLLEEMKEYYDYIILDATPITVVTDAALLLKHASGVVMVVRHEISDRELLNKAIQTLEFANAKIIGFVYTGAPVGSKRKSNYYGYGKNSSRK